MKKCSNKYSECIKQAIRSNRVVYVDIRFGSNKKGKIGYPSCPFRTIGGAMDSLSNKNRMNNEQYLISVAPGLYSEIVNMLTFVNLIGAGINLTYVQAVNFVGTGFLSQITISGQNLPLLNVILNNVDESLNTVNVENINITAPNILFTGNMGIIQTGGAGLNNEFNLRYSSISVRVSDNNTGNQILFNIGSIVNMKIYLYHL